MNIRNWSLALSFTSLLFPNVPAFSQQSLAFHPVNWQLNYQTGGFSIQNRTAKKQFVQVALSTGSVVVFKMPKVGDLDCESNLGGGSVVNSTVCELAPGERLQVDLDFEYMMYASGTYQIEMDK